MSAEIISEASRKARKVHKCNFCLLDIKVGEEYKDFFLKYEGEVYAWKEHMHCEAMFNYFTSNGYMNKSDECGQQEFNEAVWEYANNNDIAINKVMAYSEVLTRVAAHILEGL